MAENSTKGPFFIKKSFKEGEYQIKAEVDGEEVTIAIIPAKTGLDIILPSKYNAEMILEALNLTGEV